MQMVQAGFIMAKNTLVSYRRDLIQLNEWMKGQSVTETVKVTHTLLNSYILWLEKCGKATTTVSRVTASVKAFFTYEVNSGSLSENPAEGMKAPKVEKKAPTVLTSDEVERFLEQTNGKSVKRIRDRAMK